MKLGRLLMALPLVAGLSIAGATMASAQGVQAFAALFGGNETPPNTSPGFGAVALTFHGTGTVCFGIVVDRIGAPNAAHTHPGRAGTANPPAVVLVAPNAGNPGSSSGCVTLTDTPSSPKSATARRISTSMSIPRLSPTAKFADNCSEADRPLPCDRLIPAAGAASRAG